MGLLMTFTYRDFFSVSEAGQKKLCKTMATLTVAGCAAFAVAGAKPAEAASISEVFLIAEHTAPTPSTTAPLSITTQTAYKLGLNGRLRGNSFQIVNNFTIDVDAAMTFNNEDYVFGSPRDLTDLNDQGEPTRVDAFSLNPALVDAEIGTWDNVNTRSPGYTFDASEQLDFGRNAPAIFNPVQGGFTELVVAELGGLNPFDLYTCDTANCQDPNGGGFNGQKIFGGLTDNTAEALFATPHFADPDNTPGEIDQTWFFRFDAPITGFLAIVENDKRGVFNNTRLQIDFLGAGGIPSSPDPNDPPAVPLPAGLPLLVGGLGLLGFVKRRRATS